MIKTLDSVAFTGKEAKMIAGLAIIGGLSIGVTFVYVTCKLSGKIIDKIFKWDWGGMTSSFPRKIYIDYNERKF